MSMNSAAVSFLVFALTFTGALIGMALRRVLPQDHLDQDAKDTMRLAVGLVVTMTGLVLGMLSVGEDLLRWSKEQDRRDVHRYYPP